MPADGPRDSSPASFPFHGGASAFKKDRKRERATPPAIIFLISGDGLCRRFRSLRCFLPEHSRPPLPVSRSRFILERGRGRFESVEHQTISPQRRLTDEPSLPRDAQPSAFPDVSSRSSHLANFFRLPRCFPRPRVQLENRTAGHGESPVHRERCSTLQLFAAFPPPFSFLFHHSRTVTAHRKE